MRRLEATVVILLLCFSYFSTEGTGGGVRRRTEISVNEQQQQQKQQKQQQQHLRDALQTLTPFLKPGESPYKVEANSIHELLTNVESRIHVEAENIMARFQALTNKAAMKRQALYRAAELRTAAARANRTKVEVKVELIEQKLLAAEASFDAALRRADTIKGELVVSQSEKNRLNDEALKSYHMMTRTKMADLKVTLTNLKKQLTIIKGIRNMINAFTSSNKSVFNPLELKTVAQSVIEAEFNSTLHSAVPGLGAFDKV